MGVPKPFHRNVRAMMPGPNSGYSGHAFIEDPDYAQNPAHHTRALLLIIEDLKSIFEYVEPSGEGRDAFSFRIHALLMRTCIEIESNFNAIFEANIFSVPPRRTLNMKEFRRVDVTHHLSSYEALLPLWNGNAPTIKPFASWRPVRGIAAPQGTPLGWYRAYNESKHSRQQAFRKANLWSLIEAVAGLVILVTSQFGTVTFETRSAHLLLETGNATHEHSVGKLFLLKYPNDWLDHEKYDFDWSTLKMQADRFDKIDYNQIPV